MSDYDPARWARFVTMCERLGLHRDAVAGDFTADDRADLLATYPDTDPRLRRCAETLSTDRQLLAITRQLRAHDEQPPAGGSTATDLRARDQHLIGVDPALIVQCDTCAHLTRSPINPAGGVAGCAVRDDVPLQIPGRRMNCAQHTTTLIL